LDKKRAAETTTNALGCDAALLAKPLHRIHQMQCNPVAACAHGMTQRNGTAIDVELRAVESSRHIVELENLPTEPLIFPSSKTAEHLGGKRLVEFEQLDIV